MALFDAKDADHAFAERGFRQLNATRTRLVTPVPIVFEVHKWLLYQLGPTVARDALDRMRRTLMLLFLEEEHFVEAQRILVSMPKWEGSLEDALVALTAMRSRVPVWTMNYRDFAAFSKLTFWTPS